MTTTPPLFHVPQDKRQHPLIAQWALERLNDQPDGSPLGDAMAQAWFDEATLGHWLASEDTDIHIDLLRLLPSERFADFVPELEKFWCEWPYFHLATKHLIRLAPQRAAQLFLEASTGDTPPDKVLDILRHLPELEENTARTCLENLLRRIEDDQDETTSNPGLGFIQAARPLLPETALALAVRLVNALTDDVYAMESAFARLAEIFFGHGTWFGLANLRLLDESTQQFAELAPFFSADAPLAALDEALASNDIYAKALAIFETASPDHSAMRACRHLLQHCPHDGKEERDELLRDYLGALLAAAVAHLHERPAQEALDSETALLLVGMDINPLPREEAILDALSKEPREKIAAQLITRLKATRHTWGEIHLAKIMGKLAWPEFAPALIAAVSEEAGDGICEAAEEALVHIGQPASAALISGWDGYDTTQRIYLYSALRDIGGCAMADFAHARFAELLADSPEQTLDCLLAFPETRALVALAPHLRRQQALIDRAYAMLCLLLDEYPDDFAELEARVLKNRKDESERIRRHLGGDLFRNTLNVEMNCPLCGATNHYQAGHFFVSDSPVAALLVGEEFACASCGAFTDLELTDHGRFMVMTNLMMQAQASDHDITPPDMFRFVSMPFEGRPHPLNEIVAVCRARLKTHPDDVRSLISLGLAYDLTGHPQKALERLRQARQLAPHTAEARCHLARLLFIRRHFEEAWENLRDLPEIGASLNFILTDQHSAKDTAAELMRLYNALRPSGRIALHPDAITTPSKLGRNDPCPCGSGKKYKKCCGK